MPQQTTPTLFEMEKTATAPAAAIKAAAERICEAPGLFLGTSSFTASGWSGTFYPEGLKPADYLAHYASKFRSVEIDCTYYASPSASTVIGWRDKTPDDFIFAVKIPQSITHDKVLVDCDTEFREFIEVMDILGDKLGTLIFQFPCFDRWRFPNQKDFIAVLNPFLRKLPANHEFVVELRNRAWVDSRMADVLREHNVAVVLRDLPSMPRREFADTFDFVTADFVVVRWLGDRKSIEEKTKTWDKTLVDRTGARTKWAELFRQLVSRNLRIYAYANNH
jgi:uncharacterized protein YecE (DUF72 family)